MSVLENTSPDKWTAGAGPIDTVYQAAKDLDNPEDWAMDGLALGLDALGFIANPLGALAGSAVGFLIEHLSFLKEPLDDLAGGPGRHLRGRGRVGRAGQQGMRPDRRRLQAGDRIGDPQLGGRRGRGVPGEIH